MLVEAGALTKLTGSYLTQVLNTNAATMVASVSQNGNNVYGFPYTSNTWFMYYNKSVYSEEDVKSLSTMLQKGVVSFPVTNGWYLWSFYAAGGATMFGPNGTDAAYGIRLGENGTYITKYLVDLVQHPNFRVDEDRSGMEGLINGTVHAFFSGSWDSPYVKAALGENMGVAALPAININGTQKPLLAFAGSKAVGVNPHAKYHEAAMQFAAFISTPEAQKAHYEAQGIIPAAMNLASDPVIKADPMALAQMNTIAFCSVIQPTIPEMVYYWTPAQNMGWAIVAGTVTKENAAEMTQEFEKACNTPN
jgi:arabinogalactan oligomer/maltooligosaccharide transport system substrate-binding protein